MITVMRIRTKTIISLLVTLITALHVSWSLSHLPPRDAGTSSIPSSATPYVVLRVIDGDTLEATAGTSTERIRLIGIDTPESVKPNTPVQCFALEASDATKRLLEHQTVYLATDPTQDTRDRFGRLLVYAYLPDGRLVNEILIREGYAHEYTYHLPYRLKARFKEAQHEAQEAQRGLWAPGLCS